MKIVIFVTLIFSNCESTGVLTKGPASIYDRKTADRPFDTIHDILRSPSHVPKCANLKPAGTNTYMIQSVGNRRVKPVILKFLSPTKSLDHNVQRRFRCFTIGKLR